VIDRIALACAAAALLAAPTFAAEPIPTLPLAVAVAASADDGGAPRPAQDDAWIDAQIAEATRLFTAHASMRFAKTSSRAIDARYAHMETRADRDSLAPLARLGVINVFVVASLRDVDEADRMRMGVCWSPHGDRSARYVILSAIAKPSVLAHELGHFHGLPHSRVTNNVMIYERDGGPIFFDAIQARAMRAEAQSLLRDGKIRP